MKLPASVTEEYLYGVQEGAGIETIERFNNISSILIFGLNVAMGVGVAVTIFNLGFTAIMYVLSKGEPKNVKKAQDAAIWSALGMAIIIGSWAFKKIALSTLGVTEGIVVDEPSF